MSLPETQSTHEQALAMLEELRLRLAAVERMVAPRMGSSPLPTADFTVLLVDVRGIMAAIALEVVQEVVPYAWLTAIPEAPRWAAGVLDLGGRAIHVMDVAARIAGDGHCPNAEDFIVICRMDDRLVGLCVTGLHGVVTFTANAVSPASTDIPAAPYMIGTISHADCSILFLGVEQLLHASDPAFALEAST